MQRLITLIIAAILFLPTSTMAADLDTMIGQMLMAGFRGYTVNQKSPIIQDIKERHLGGVILFDYDVALGKPERNIQSPDQVKALTDTLSAAAHIPLLIGVDQEGGRVMRLKPERGFEGTPSAQELGAGSNEAILRAADTTGKTLFKAGFNLDFAPVADVNVDPTSPAIGKLGRSFSADPKRVAECDRYFLAGLTANGVVGCLKHFPGHGSAGADSHLGLTDVSRTWSERELIPYRELIKGGLARVIMTAHIFNEHLDPKYPATLSKRVITGILREKLGFDGVVITDDMNMKAITSQFGQEEAIKLAIQAGADILLFGNNLDYDPDVVKKAHDTIRTLVMENVIPEERIVQSHARIMKLKENL